MTTTKSLKTSDIRPLETKNKPEFQVVPPSRISGTALPFAESNRKESSKPLCTECGTNDDRNHAECHDEQMRLKHPAPEKREVESKYTHDQLLEALYWIFDVFERANMNFFLIYSTAEAVLKNKGLEGDRVEVGVRKLEWISGARVIIDAFAQYESDEGEVIRYIAPNGVPVVVKTFRDDHCITSPDTIVYQQEHFKVPNPYDKFLEVFGE